MNIAKIVFGGWIQCNKCSNWLQAGSQTVLFTMLCPHRNDFCHLQFTVSSKQCTNLLYYWVVQKVQLMFPCHPVEKSESTFWPMQCFSLGKYPSLLVLGIFWSTGIMIPSPEGLYHFGVLPGQILWHDVDLLVPTITSFPLQSLLCHGLPQLLNFSQGSEKCFCEALPGIKQKIVYVVVTQQHAHTHNTEPRGALLPVT